MIATRPDIDPLGTYSQADAARRLGVHRHTLAKWEKIPFYRLKPVTKRFKKGKHYKGADLLRIWAL